MLSLAYISLAFIASSSRVSDMKSIGYSKQIFLSNHLQSLSIKRIHFLYSYFLSLAGRRKTSIPTDDHIPKIRHCRSQHSMVFQIPSASKDGYKIASFLELSENRITSLIL